MKLGSPYQRKATAAARAALAISASVCSIFECPNNGMVCFGFLTFAQMLMHAIAHEGCTNIVSEPGLEGESEKKEKKEKKRRKKLAASETRTRAPGFSGRQSTN